MQFFNANFRRLSIGRVKISWEWIWSVREIRHTQILPTRPSIIQFVVWHCFTLGKSTMNNWNDFLRLGCNCMVTKTFYLCDLLSELWKTCMEFSQYLSCRDRDSYYARYSQFNLKFDRKCFIAVVIFTAFSSTPMSCKKYKKHGGVRSVGIWMKAKMKFSSK